LKSLQKILLPSSGISFDTVVNHLLHMKQSFDHNIELVNEMQSTIQVMVEELLINTDEIDQVAFKNGNIKEAVMMELRPDRVNSNMNRLKEMTDLVFAQVGQLVVEKTQRDTNLQMKLSRRVHQQQQQDQ
jgi:hypothetical protein